MIPKKRERNGQAGRWTSRRALGAMLWAAVAICTGGVAIGGAEEAAKRLLSVEARNADGATVLVLQADGPIQSPKTFVLEQPARLVVDLKGVKNAVAKGRIDVGSAQVKTVRVAQHDEKTRVVIDGAAEGVFVDRGVATSPDGLVVAIGAKAQEVAEATARERGAAPAMADAAPAPGGQDAAAPAAASPAAPAEADKGVVLRGIQLDTAANRERVVLVSEGSLHYEVTEPDAESIVLRLPGATLAPEAALKVQPEKPGTVSLVSAYVDGDASGEVRVLIRRTAGVAPKIRQDGSAVLIDFPHGEDTAGALPLLTPAENAVAKGAAKPAAAKAEASADKGAPGPAAPAAGGSSSILKEGGLLAGKQYTGRRISLDLKDVEIDDVLRLIAEVSELNVIAGDDVSGKVTIRLVDVPWDQALDVILLTKGLGFVRVGSVLRIAPQTLLQQEEEARLQERRAKEKLEDLQVKLLPVNYANVEEVEKMVKKMLSSRGIVNTDKRTSTLIVKDIPSVLNEATNLVTSIDTQTPQVLIETRIVEANLDFSRELGAEWAVGSNPPQKGGEGSDEFTVGTTKYTTAPNSTWPFQSPNNVVVSNPITSVANGLLNLSGFVLDDRFNVALQIQAAESNGEGKVISSPRVVTLDNREAKIEQGLSIPFQTFENGDAQLEFIDAVLSLLVTPHITQDKSIIMKIEVTRNAPDDTVPTPTGSPAISKNEAKTETLVKNGQTLVLGGIYVIDKSERQTRVPYLHRIPLLGQAFKSKSVADKRKELLFFVTPRIVESAVASAQQP